MGSQNQQKIRMLDLFSGIGGWSIAGDWLGYEIVGHVEQDEWCQRVLKKHWPDARIVGDVREVTGTEFGPVDLVVGSPPCQPFSQAGKRGGTDDDRHLWPEMARIIGATRPRYVLLENVSGIRNVVLDEIFDDLEGLDYSVRAVSIPAGAVEALHRRDRIWVMAHANGSDVAERGEREDLPEQGDVGGDEPGGGDVDSREIADGGTGKTAGGRIHRAVFLDPDLGAIWDRLASGNLANTHGPREQQPAEGGDQERLRSRNSNPADISGFGVAGPGDRPFASDTGEGDFVYHSGDLAYSISYGLEGKLQSGPEARPTVGGGSGAEAQREIRIGTHGVSPGLVLGPAVVRHRWRDGTFEHGISRAVELVPRSAEAKHNSNVVKAAGNAIVPVVAYELLKVLVGETP